MDAALLGLRVVLSLACVLGLIWFAGRKLQGTAGVRRQRTVPLAVLGRQSLGKGAGVALVEVAGRVLLLGVGEQGVRVLTEVDVPPAEPSTERPGEVREEIDLATLALVDDLDAEREVTVAASPRRPVAVDDEPGGDTAPGADLASDVPAPHTDGTARLAALAGLAAGASGVSTSGAAVASTRRREVHAPTAGALRGSILSPGTWRRTVDSVQRRAAR